jgi:hypothetical protein
MKSYAVAYMDVLAACHEERTADSLRMYSGMDKREHANLLSVMIGRGVLRITRVDGHVYYIKA